MHQPRSPSCPERFSSQLYGLHLRNLRLAALTMECPELKKTYEMKKEMAMYTFDGFELASRSLESCEVAEGNPSGLSQLLSI